MERRIRPCKDQVKEEAVPHIGVGVRAGCDEEVSVQMRLACKRLRLMLLAP